MGFAEIFVIAIVGLLVIGPDKLPQTIKTCLLWFGRLKRLINDTRSEFEQQLGVDEIRREIHNDEVMASLKALKVAKDEAVSDVEGYAEQARKELDEIKNFDDFNADDEGLFGEQHANHPPEQNEEDPVENAIASEVNSAAAAQSASKKKTRAKDVLDGAAADDKLPTKP